MDNHKEQIHRSIVSQINNKSHYLGDNDFLPVLLGKKSFVYKESMEQFTFALIKVKKIFGLDDIDVNTYFNLEKEISHCLKEISRIEANNIDVIEEMAHELIYDYFQFDEDFELKMNIGKCVNKELNLSKNVKKSLNDVNVKIDNYLKIEEQNKQLDRRRLIYSIICGAASDMMDNILLNEYENKLDNVDYKLQDLYKKYVAFNNFKIWVTPDNLLKQYKNTNQFKINENGISAHGDNCLFLLYQTAKGIYSKIFDEIYENEMIEYNNVWNLRIGILIWKKIKAKIGHTATLKHIVTDLNELDNDSFQIFFNELLADTIKSDKMFKSIGSLYGVAV